MTSVKFVKGNDSNISSLSSAVSDGIQDTNSGTIGFYISGSTAYIAPMNKSNSTSVLYAPSDSRYMFKKRTESAGYHSIASIDFSNLDTSKVTQMNGLFFACTDLTTISNMDFDTSNVTNMVDMFYSCTKLSTIDVSSFDTSNVANMSCMFQSCNELTNIIGLNKLKTDNVTTMSSVFNNDVLLTSLDLSSFNTAKVTSMVTMFSGCTALTTIKASNAFVTTNVGDSTDMFKGCSNLRGSLGTIFDSTKIDKTYARIDGGTSSPGYFSN